MLRLGDLAGRCQFHRPTQSCLAQLKSTSDLSCRFPLRRSRAIPSRCSSTSRSPRVASGSVWRSVIPRFLRKRGSDGNELQQSRRSGWNPATFYIIMALIIGSNAIQMIALRNSHQVFSRKADLRLSRLREAVGRIQRGEDVDIEGILGTGDESEETEWSEVMRELQSLEPPPEETPKELPKDSHSAQPSERSETIHTKENKYSSFH